MSRDPASGSPSDWLRHARSDLALARTDPEGDILPATLCFHAQQAAEKSIKAVLIQAGLAIPRTHNIRTLLDLLPANVRPPANADEASTLTAYAVMTRYPIETEPIDIEELTEALETADTVLSWAAALIESDSKDD